MKRKSFFLMMIAAGIAALMMIMPACKKDDDKLKPSTVADFSFVADNNAFAPSTVTFTDLSQNAVGYHWDFGNGETSTDKSPSVTYIAPGAYEVTLTVQPKEELHYNQLVKKRTIVIKDPLAGAQVTLFFTDRTTKSVRHFLLDGNAPLIQDFGHTGLDKPYGIVIDTINDHVFVSDYGADVIYRYNIDGMGLTTVVSKATFGDIAGPIGLFIWDGKLYWSQEGGIFRCNLDGSNPEVWIAMPTTSAPEMPVHMAFDPATQIIYFTNDKYDFSGGVYRVNLDGTGLTLLVSGTDGGAIAIDTEGGKIYYADYEKGICMANLDGTGEVVINTAVQNRFVWGMALNKPEGKLYWGNRQSNVIVRANLDGSTPENFATTVNPHGMTLDKAR